MNTKHSFFDIEKTIVKTLLKNNFTNVSFNIYDENIPETDFLTFDENNKEVILPVF